MKLKHLDLFSGIGGFSLGLEATGGFETVAFCDIDQYPRQVLQKHWPHVKQYEDIKELNYERLKADGLLPIDIITGGYPCQPFSVAGRKKGEDDPRHLWPEYFRLVKELRPTWVIGENVSGHIKLGLDTVISDLESEDYAVRPFSISASSIGANHQRERVWIVANSRRPRGPWSKLREENENETRKENANQFERSSSTLKSNVANTERIGQQGQGELVRSSGSTKNSDGQTGWSYDGSQGAEGWWEFEPNVGRVAYGIPKRVDRLKSLGNSLVPQIPYYIGKTILEVMNGKTN
jgi:DNA (cytosine-5)-methyltransferase 1